MCKRKCNPVLNTDIYISQRVECIHHTTLLVPSRVRPWVVVMYWQMIICISTTVALPCAAAILGYIIRYFQTYYNSSSEANNVSCNMWQSDQQTPKTNTIEETRKGLADIHENGKGRLICQAQWWQRMIGLLTSYVTYYIINAIKI